MTFINVNRSNFFVNAKSHSKHGGSPENKKNVTDATQANQHASN